MIVDTLLITGAGGDIGLSIARLLRDGGHVGRLIGADCNAAGVAHAFFNEFALLPRADNAEYIEALIALARRVGASAIMPLAEAELAVLLREGLIAGRVGDTPVLTANVAAIATGLDKLRTFETLRAAGIPTPDSGIVGETEPTSFPCIIKPRQGQGSKRVTLVDAETYPDVAADRQGDLWQRFLPGEDAEYTCGLIRLSQIGTRSIIFRRRLSGGLTGSGEHVVDAGIDTVLAQVADALDLHGSINVQLRIVDGVPHIFEINARFSSTVGFRHRLGFQDVVWTLSDLLEYPVGEYAPPPPGSRIFRIAQEVVLPPAA